MPVFQTVINVDKAAPYLWIGITVLSIICAYHSDKKVIACLFFSGTATLILSIAGTSVYIQTIIFFILSVLLLTTVFLIKMMSRKNSNAIVVDRLDCYNTGYIYMHGKFYTARMSDNDNYIAAGNIVSVTGDNDGIFICRKIK